MSYGRTTALVRTSETRFANSKPFLFIKVLDNVPTIAHCLENRQIQNKEGDARAKAKANDAASLQGRLLNGTTLLEIASLCDIYYQW